MLTFNDRAKEQLLGFLSLASADSPDTPLIDTTTITKHLPWLSEVFAQLSNNNGLDFRNLHYFLHHEAFEHAEISAKSLSDFWLFCFNHPTMSKENQKKMIELAIFHCASQGTDLKKFDLLLEVILKVPPNENDVALINLLTRLFCGKTNKQQFQIVFDKISEKLKQSLFPLLLKAAIDSGDFELIEDLKAYHHRFFSHKEASEQSLSDFWLFCFNYPTMSKESQKKMIEGFMLGVKKENKSALENFYLLLQSILEMAQKENNLTLAEPIAMFFFNEEKTFEIDFDKISEALQKFLFPLLLKAFVDSGDFELFEDLKAYHHRFFSHEEASEQSLSDFWLFCFNHPTMSKKKQKKMIEGLMLGVKKENKSASENFYLLLQAIFEMAQKENNPTLMESIALFFCNEEKTFEIDFDKLSEELKKSLFQLLLKTAIDHGNSELVKHFLEDPCALFKDVDQALQQKSNIMLALNDSDRAFFSKSIDPFLRDSGAIDLTSYSSKLIMAARMARKKEYDHTLTFLGKTVEKTLFVRDLSSEVAFLGVDFSSKNAEVQKKAFQIINDEKQNFIKKVPAWVKMPVATGECPYFVLRLNHSNEKIEIVSIKDALNYSEEHAAIDEIFEAHKGKPLSTKDFFSRNANSWQKVIGAKLFVRNSGPLYHEFADYLDLIKASVPSFYDVASASNPVLDEIFVMGGDGTHQIAGEIRLDQTGATMVLIDSLGMYYESSIDIKFHSVLKYAIKSFLERFPKGQVYIETVKRQNTGTGCGLFAALDTQKLHSFRRREGNIFKWLEDQTKAMMADSKQSAPALRDSFTEAIQKTFESDADKIHMTKLPPEFMLPQQSRALFQEGPLSITARGDHDRFLGKRKSETPLTLYKRFIESGSQFSDRFGDSSKENPKMGEKAQNYRAHIVDYLLDRLSKHGGQETIARELRACSLEGFEERMRSGQVLKIAGDPAVPATSKSHKSPR
ncbi:MAG: hypothetical protein KBD23_05215 [Gammaproteobacteria bacterium]|nr:hypothetical protein [Gammaproteobacteria bacterium]MBP9729514.1 hypothetical protein [Gammaproteobacteria bacterium]